MLDASWSVSVVEGFVSSSLDEAGESVGSLASEDASAVGVAGTGVPASVMVSTPLISAAEGLALEIAVDIVPPMLSDLACALAAFIALRFSPVAVIHGFGKDASNGSGK